MASYATPKLEFSPDPLSDTTPAWTDITRFLVSADWSDGRQREFDDPQAGQAKFVLRNDFQSGANRQFEPEYASGAWYPNIVPRRRLRWSITADGVSYPLGIWYVTAWTPQYLAQSSVSMVSVSCVDGFGLLALDVLGPLDPPEATTYPEVVTYDQPYLYCRLAETSGTLMKAEVGADGFYSGFGGGVYGSQSPPLVTGDPTTGIVFAPTATTNPVGKSPVDQTNHFADTNQITVEAVVQLVTASGTTRDFLAGPFLTSAAVNTFYFGVNSAGNLTFAVVYTSGGTVIGVSTTTTPLSDLGRHHVCATWNGHLMSIYVDGVLLATQDYGGRAVQVGNTNNFLWIGSDTQFTAGDVTVNVQEAAFYEYALSAKRIAAHAYAAITAGYAAQTSGARVAAITSNPLWSTAGIPATGLQMRPVMWTGQYKIDEVMKVVGAEKPDGIFMFTGAGNPDYEVWDDANEGVVDAIFGDSAGEVNYDAITPAFDDDVYNRSIVSAVDSPVHQVDSAADQPPVLAYSDQGRILSLEADVQTVAQTVVDRFSTPHTRVDQLALNGSRPMARAQILNRQIGDVIEIRKRGEGGTIAIDIVARILGRSFSFDVNGDLRCSYQLSRGFRTDGFWHLGVAGFSELNNTTALG